MLLCVTVQQEIALSLPPSCMKKVVDCFNFHLPLVPSSILSRKSQAGTSAILGSLKGFNEIGVSRATSGLFEFLVELYIIVAIESMIMWDSSD
jgi:hypothetical protein